jgi:hypothetical protein
MMAITPLLRRPWIVIAWAVLAMVAPIALEAAGVLGRTFWIDDGTMRLRSAVVSGGDATLEIAMVVANLLFIAMTALFARATNRDRRAAERRLHIQAWHLRHLLPDRTLAAPS